MMTIETIVQRLEANARAIAALVEGVGADQARWRPGAEHWSILEVVTHLADEEPEDFRTRLHLTLEDPSQDWPEIDPQGWVTARDYNAGDLAASLARFERERRASIAWLRSLEGPDWSRSKPHPAGFSMHAGDLLSAWLAHDLAHVHQLAELQAAWLRVGHAPYEIGYSGWDPHAEDVEAQGA